jgi:hypothetical protein
LNLVVAFVSWHIHSQLPPTFFFDHIQFNAPSRPNPWSLAPDKTGSGFADAFVDSTV